MKDIAREQIDALAGERAKPLSLPAEKRAARPDRDRRAQDPRLPRRRGSAQGERGAYPRSRERRKGVRPRAAERAEHGEKGSVSPKLGLIRPQPQPRREQQQPERFVIGKPRARPAHEKGVKTYAGADAKDSVDHEKAYPLKDYPAQKQPEEKAREHGEKGVNGGVGYPQRQGGFEMYGERDAENERGAASVDERDEVVSRRADAADKGYRHGEIIFPAIDERAVKPDRERSHVGRRLCQPQEIKEREGEQKRADLLRGRNAFHKRILPRAAPSKILIFDFLSRKRALFVKARRAGKSRPERAAPFLLFLLLFLLLLLALLLELFAHALA